MTSTFRVDTRAAVKTLLDAYVAAHPTTLLAAYTSRPAGFTDLPCAYIGRPTEVIRQDRSTRDRTLTVSVVLVDRLTTSAEVTGRLDALLEGVLDALTAGMRSIPNAGPLDIVGTEPVELDINGITYEAELIHLSAVTQEGTGL